VTRRLLRPSVIVAVLVSAALAPAVIGAQGRGATTPAVRQPDVVGIRLGLSAEQAAQALRAFNPRTRIRSVQESFRGVTFVSTIFAGAFGDDRLGTGDDLFRLQFSNPPDSRLVLIGRQQRFPSGHEFAAAQVVAAFEEKYGPALYKGGAALLTNLGWAAGVAGQPAPSQAICQGAANAGVALSGNVVLSPQAPAIDARLLLTAAACGVTVGARIDHFGGLVSMISTGLIDYPAVQRTGDELQTGPSNTRPQEAEERGKPRL
jgi:hypothetical protein